MKLPNDDAENVTAYYAWSLVLPKRRSLLMIVYPFHWRRDTGESMTTQNLYLNHAGTSWPEPRIVSQAVHEAMLTFPAK